jgi:ACR3 family arsenite transporter
MESHTEPALKQDPLGIFGRYLSVWVVLCGGVGVVIGEFVPSVPDALNKATIAQISVPVAVLIWLMVIPMVAQIDLLALKDVWSNKRPVFVTSSINYLVQPFAMYALARLFFNVVFSSVINDSTLEDEYVAGAVILGGSPCTAMVFVWSLLTHGDPAYTLVQVAVNDILIFVFYIPTLMLLLQITDISVPWDTAFLSVVLFMLVPGIIGASLRFWAKRRRDLQWLGRVLAKLQIVSMAALLGTLVLIFTF